MAPLRFCTWFMLYSLNMFPKRFVILISINLVYINNNIWIHIKLYEWRVYLTSPYMELHIYRQIIHNMLYYGLACIPSLQGFHRNLNRMLMRRVTRCSMIEDLNPLHILQGMLWLPSCEGLLKHITPKSSDKHHDIFICHTMHVFNNRCLWKKHDCKWQWWTD